MPTYLENKKGKFDFEIIEMFEAGIALAGFEVKALRSKKGTLAGSFVSLKSGDARLTGANIPPYQVANTPNGYDPKRDRKLLLHKKEIAKLTGYEGQKGLTVIPLSVYSKGTKLKLKIAVVRGKKKRDKRQKIKKRDLEREISRSLKKKIVL